MEQHHWIQCWATRTEPQHYVAGICSCAQTLYALKVLRAYGMCDSALQSIYKSVIVAKLLYATSAWWGFAVAINKQRNNAFLLRGQRNGVCPTDASTLEKLCVSSDKHLFDAILANPNHELTNFYHHFQSLLKATCYGRVRATDSLHDNYYHLCLYNFINRMLYKNSYWYYSPIFINQLYIYNF